MADNGASRPACGWCDAIISLETLDEGPKAPVSLAPRLATALRTVRMTINPLTMTVTAHKAPMPAPLAPKARLTRSPAPYARIGGERTVIGRVA